MPMTLQVRNAGAAMRQTQTYEPVIMPPLLQPSRRGPAEQGTSIDSGGSKANLEVASSKLLHHANSQVKVMEDLYKEMLRRCHDAAKDAVTDIGPPPPRPPTRGMGPAAPLQRQQYQWQQTLTLASCCYTVNPV